MQMPNLRGLPKCVSFGIVRVSWDVTDDQSLPIIANCLFGAPTGHEQAMFAGPVKVC